MFSEYSSIGCQREWLHFSAPEHCLNSSPKHTYRCCCLATSKLVFISLPCTLRPCQSPPPVRFHFKLLRNQVLFPGHLRALYLSVLHKQFASCSVPLWLPAQNLLLTSLYVCGATQLLHSSSRLTLPFLLSMCALQLGSTKKTLSQPSRPTT